MLTAAEIARIVEQDAWQRATRDDARLRGLGIIPVRRFDPAEPREPHSGKWTAGGGAIGDATEHLAKLGHAVFTDVEQADSVDQVVDGMRKHKAANPDVSVDELIHAVDQAIAAKYPPDQHPNINGFYSKMLSGRHADIAKPLPGKTKSAPTPTVVKPKSAPAPSDYPTLTAKQAQAMQDGMPPPWTGPQRMGLRYYTGNSAVANGLLRGWIQPPGKTASDRKKIEAAQRNIAHATAAMRPSTQPITVRRTVGPEQFGVATTKDLDNLVGHVMVERGFLSTSTKKSVGVGGKVNMEIEVPAGTRMAFVKSVSKYEYEDEVLLPPGMKYQLISVTQTRGRATVRVRVVPE